MLKAWGVPVVVATWSPDSFKLVKSLGAIPIDYNDSLVREELIEYGPYDVILDCAESELAEWSDKIMGIWRHSFHVSVISPLLHDTDRYSLIPGLFSTAAKYFWRASRPALSGRWFSYAFFTPNLECLEEVKEYVECEMIKPIVERTYSFEEIPAAYEKVFERHGRGKTIIDFDKGLKRGPTLFEEKPSEVFVKAEATAKVEKVVDEALAQVQDKPVAKVYTESRAKTKSAESDQEPASGEVKIPAPSAEATLKVDPVVASGEKPGENSTSPPGTAPV